MTTPCCEHGDVEASLRESLADCLQRLAAAKHALYDCSEALADSHASKELYNHNGLISCECTVAMAYRHARLILDTK